jgi:hypothetical protein
MINVACVILNTLLDRINKGMEYVACCEALPRAEQHIGHISMATKRKSLEILKRRIFGVPFHPLTLHLSLLFSML